MRSIVYYIDNSLIYKKVYYTTLGNKITDTFCQDDNQLRRSGNSNTFAVMLISNDKNFKSPPSDGTTNRMYITNVSSLIC